MHWKFQYSPRDHKDSHTTSRNSIIVVVLMWSLVSWYLSTSATSACALVLTYLRTQKLGFYHFQSLRSIVENKTLSPDNLAGILNGGRIHIIMKTLIGKMWLILKIFVPRKICSNKDLGFFPIIDWNFVLQEWNIFVKKLDSISADNDFILT